MKTSLTWRVLWLFPVLASSVTAGQREVVSGYVEPVILRPYDFLFRPAVDREPSMGLMDGFRDYTISGAQRARMDVERDAGPSATLAGGTALRLLPDEVLACCMEYLQVRVPSWQQKIFIGQPDHLLPDLDNVDRRARECAQEEVEQ